MDEILKQIKDMIDKTRGHSADFRIDGELFRGTVLRSEIDLDNKTVQVWVFAPGLDSHWPYVKIDHKDFDTVYMKNAFH